MAALHMFRSRKYLQRILLYVCLVMVLLVVFSSYTVYYNAEKTVLNMQYEANKKVLGQMNYNISNMNEMIQNLAISVFFDHDMVPMMYGKEDGDFFDLTRSIIKINTAVASTSFLDSIVVYNGISDKFYSSNTVTQSELLYQKMKTVLNANQSVPKMKLIPMSLQGDRIDFFSIILYESMGSYEKNESALILNIKSKWLFDNIKYINNLDSQQHGAIYVMDAQNVFLNPEVPLQDQDGIEDYLATHLQSSQQEADYFATTINHNKYLVTHLTSQANGWKIVTVQPFESIMSFVTKLRIVSILSIAIFLLVTIILAFFISHKLYKPIEVLMKQIKGKPNAEDLKALPESDELAYLSHAYEHIFDKMNIVMKEKDAKKDIVKQYYMKQILTVSEGMTEREFTEILEQQHLNIMPSSAYFLCVIKIDRLQSLEQHRNELEKNIINFAILNISEEIIGKSYINQTVDLKSDHLVILVSQKDSDSLGAKEELMHLLNEVQQVITKFYRISISAAISDGFHSYSQISKQYHQTLHCIKYRLVFGEKSIITTEMITQNENNKESHISSEYEKNFTEAIKSGNYNVMVEQLDKMINLASKLHYDQAIHTVLRMTIIMNQVYKDVNRNKIRPIQIDLTGFTDRVLEQETLVDMAKEIKPVLTEMAEKLGQKDDDERVTVLVQAIKETIDQNYFELDLSLQKVSSMLKLSTSYVGKIFKSSESVSVAEYLNEVRLSHALKLLEERSYSIQEIMGKVGFSSESNFYKLFKKRFGTTPKEYRVKRMLD
jgi:AraC-like DNA-binding protein/uncharacterized protein YneF (UPF0154 family)